MSGPELVGTWQLVSVTAQQPDGKTTEPYGHRPNGILTYDSDGRVVTVIIHENLEDFESASIAAATRAEASYAFRRTLAYFGRYELDRDTGTVVHRIEGCTFPNWMGDDRLRLIEIEDGRMTMTTPPLRSGGGEEAVFTLVWERP